MKKHMYFNREVEGASGAPPTAEQMEQDFIAPGQQSSNGAADTQNQNLDAQAKAKADADAKAAAEAKATADAKAAADGNDAQKAADAEKAKAGESLKVEIGEGKSVDLKKTWGKSMFETGEGAAAAPPAIDHDKLAKENEAMKKLLDAPLIKSIIAGQANGKDPWQVMKEVSGVDPDTLSDEEIFRMDLAQLGITDEKAIEREVDAFNNKMPSDQKRTTLPIRDRLKAERDKKLGEYGNSQLSFFNNNKTSQEEAFKKNAADFQDLSAKLKGQKLYGVVEVTDEMVTNLNTLMTEKKLLPLRSDGTVEPAALLKFALFMQYGDLINDTIGKTAAMQAYEQFKSESFTPENPGSNGNRLNASLPRAEEMKKDFE